MTEDQADTIIDLLKEISDKLPKKTSYDMCDLYSAIDDVKSSVDDAVKAIKNLDIS